MTQEAVKVELKPTNPKQDFGFMKVSITRVPFTVLDALSLGMGEGGYKYGAYNYREAGVLASTYVDAAFRHLKRFWEGQDYDTEAAIKLHHIGKAMTSLAVLYDAIVQSQEHPHLFVDDRPPPTRESYWDESDKLAAEQRERMIAAEHNKPPVTRIGLLAKAKAELAASVGKVKAALFGPETDLKVEADLKVAVFLPTIVRFTSKYGTVYASRSKKDGYLYWTGNREHAEVFPSEDDARKFVKDVKFDEGALFFDRPGGYVEPSPPSGEKQCWGDCEKPCCM
jgi:hypothetical protein